MEDYPGNILNQEHSEKFEMYQEFCKLTVYNKLLNDRYQELVVKKEKFKQKLDMLQDTFPNGKPRRFRRNADQIKRIFRCENCDKSYGSEASLKNHLKFKHQPYSTVQINEFPIN